MPTLTQILPDGRKVVIEISPEGHVIVSGHSKLTAHQVCQVNEDGLTFNVEPNIPCNHISFQTEVAPDGKSVALKIVSGPTPLWPHDCAPGMTIMIRQDGTLAILAGENEGLPLLACRFDKKWKIPWTFQRAQAYLDSLPDRLSEEQMACVNAIITAMGNLRCGDERLVRAINLESYAMMRMERELGDRKRDLQNANSRPGIANGEDDQEPMGKLPNHHA